MEAMPPWVAGAAELGAVAAGMLDDWVLPFVYNVTLDGFRASALGSIFLGGLVALADVSRTQGEEA